MVLKYAEVLHVVAAVTCSDQKSDFKKKKIKNGTQMKQQI